MFLTKDGITVDVSHPSDVARYKKLGYVEVKDASPVAEVAPETPEPTQQEKDQKTVEDALQSTKKGSKK